MKPLGTLIVVALIVCLAGCQDALRFAPSEAVKQNVAIASESSARLAILTDTQDMHTLRCDLQVELIGETCEWLTASVVDWFAESVREAVKVEFDRFIAAGDLQKTIERLEQLQATSDAQGGFLGAWL